MGRITSSKIFATSLNLNQVELSFKICNTVFENIDEIKECFNIILNGDEFQDVNTINLASGHIKIIEGNNFKFWHSFFHKISRLFFYGRLQKKGH